MLVGSRVVRGPDWEFEEEEEDQDGGEGFVGTITSTQNFQDGSPLPKGKVLVYWDTGYQGCYRAGLDGCYDLRILDSAPSGIDFSSHSCNECNQAGISGMRWQCAVCPNYSLCTLCYMKDVHDMNHSFMRFDVSNDSANGVDVGQRFGCLKIQAKGIFPGAIVKTGNDWTSESLRNGKVLELASWEGIPRSAAIVDWENFCELHLRVGHKGKVDLELVTSSLGPLYYKDHLPSVSLDDMNSLKKKQFSTSSEKQAQHKMVDLELVTPSLGPLYCKDHLPSVSLDDMNSLEKKQFSTSSEKQAQHKMESSVQSNQNAEDQQKELQHEVIKRLQKGEQSDNTTSAIKSPPPRTLPKPSRQRLPNNNSSNSNVVEQSEAKDDQPTTEPIKKVKDIVNRMSQADLNKGDSGGRTPVQSRAPAPPKPAIRADPSDANTLPKTSKKTYPAPPPPRPRSAILAGSVNISPEPKKKEAKVAPSRTNVASLAASLGNKIQLDPTRGRMQTKKPPARDIICTYCDEKASKVFFEPCGHFVDKVCFGCARKYKRCHECNQPIDKKSTSDGSQLPELDDEMDTYNKEKLKELERKLDEAKRELECPICMDERCNVLFGCGHKTCMECSDLIGQGNNQCPICKQLITERKRMF
ncbi:E3 ubiquitin-protein ligase MIB1-like [Actinia tenebrosa]|uniref:E3 ubiquitin-protein ligase MIB1-like n=1 Tax=Actinia tenebrosa TaxID=6105 RepID=A0A6P8GZX4_ACTTE|nr:E3 ubiquitin-protein ligase MIB1-like [Actinia tenebrosa]